MDLQRDGGVQEQIDATVIDAINRARSHLHHEHNDTNYCLECGELIPEARRNIIPGVELCVECQAKKMHVKKHSVLITAGQVKTVNYVKYGGCF